MNLNLFLKELKRNAFSLFIWIIIITMFISVTMAVYPTFVKNQSKVMGMLSLIPKGALEFKGISNIDDILSKLGFYAANNIIYMMVLGSIYAIVLSSNILLKEEYNKTAEYLLTRPLTRGEIFISKLAVLQLNVLMLNLLTAGAGLTALVLIKDGTFSITAFLILSFYTLLLNILFSSLGLFLSTLVKRSKPITTISIALVLGFYFIFTLSKITEGIEEIGYLSPFRFVDTNVLNPDYALNKMYLIYFIGLSALLTALSYRVYRRKDIYL